MLRWTNETEERQARLISLIGDRIAALTSRSYDQEQLLGAAPLFMANDRRVVLHDLDYIISVAQNLRSSIEGE